MFFLSTLTLYGCNEITAEDLGIVITTDASLVYSSSSAYLGYKATGSTWTKTYTVYNRGTTAANITVAPYTSGHASITMNTHTCGAVLEGGSSCTVDIGYAPGANGSFASELRIVYENTGDELPVSKTAAMPITADAGNPASLSVTPGSLDFYGSYGFINITDSTADLTFTISNVGATPAADAELSLKWMSTGTDFDFTHDSCFFAAGGLLSDGASCEIKMRFNPQQTGDLGDVLNLSWLDGSNTPPADITRNLDGRTPYKITMFTGVPSFSAGSCNVMEIQIQSQTSIASTVSKSTVISLGGPGDIEYYDVSDTTCSGSQISSLTLTTGVSNKQFRVRDTLSGTPSLSIANTDASLQSLSYPVTVNSGAGSKIVLTTSPADFSTATSSNLSVEIQDAYNNKVSGDNTTQVTFTPTNNGAITAVGTGTGDASYGVAGGAETVTVASGVASITLEDTSVETFSLSFANDQAYTNPGVESVNVGLGPATQVVLATAGVDFNAGGSTTVTLQIQDADGNLVTTDNSTNLTFDPALSGTVSAVNTGTLTSGPIGDVGDAETVTVSSGIASVTVTDNVAETFGISFTNNQGFSNPGADSILVSPGAADYFCSVTGNSQNTIVSQAAPTNPGVNVCDRYGNSVGGGITVEFIHTGAGADDGSIANTSTSTNGSGFANAGTWTMNSTNGVNTVTATGAGASALADLAGSGFGSRVITATSKNPATLSITGGNGGGGNDHNFGTVPSGSTQDVTLTITNNATSAVDATLITAGSISSPDIDWKGGSFPGTGATCIDNQTLSEGSTCTVVVTYSPSSVASHGAASNLDLSFHNGVSGGQSSTGTITGTAVSVASLSISDGVTYDYGTHTTTSNTDKIFTLTNSGTTQATSIAEGGLAPPYQIKGGSWPGTGGSCSAGGTLNTGACTFVVTYTPTTVATHPDSIDIGYNDGVAAQNATRDVSGAGVSAASVTITSGNSYNFGTVINNGGANDTTFTINNGGGNQATSVTPAILDTYMSIVNGGGTPCGAAPFTLNAGASCTFLVRYNPTGSSDYSAASDNLSIAYNDLDLGPQTSELGTVKGKSVPVASLSWTTGTKPSPSYDFGNKANGSSTDVTFTVSNAASVFDASISSGTVTGPYFTFQGGSYPGTNGNCPVGTLSAGNSCLIVVTYAPGALGVHGAANNIDIAYNDGLSAQNLYGRVDGTGVAPAVLTIQGVDPYDYGTKASGSTTAYVFTLENTGAAQATGITLGFATGTHFDHTGGSYPGGGSCGPTLNPGTCTFAVDFVPGTTGALADTITVDYNDGAAAATQVNHVIQGTGAAPAILAVSVCTGTLPDTNKGDTSATQTCTINNTGGVTATSVAITMDSTDASAGDDFGISGSTCGTSIVAAGSCNFDVSFSPSTVGNITDIVNIDYNNGASAQTATKSVSGDTPYKYVYTASPTPITAGVCSAYTIQAQTDSSAVINLSSAATVNLSDAGSGTFFTDASCTGGNETATASITGGSSSTTFYYKNETAEGVTIDADSSSIGVTGAGQTASVAVTVNPDVATEYAVSMATTTTAGTTETISVSLKDQFGNTVTSGANASDTVTISSNDAYPAAFPGGNSVNLSSGAGTVDITFKTATTGASITGSGALTSGTQTSITVNPGPAVAGSITLQELDWWNTDFIKRMKIGLDATFLSASLTDFPVMIKLSAGVNSVGTAFSYADTQNAGEDIRFCLNRLCSGGTLDYEIENWNEAGDSIIHVRIPTLTNANNFYIWMYYDHTSDSATDAQNATGVWDSNFVNVLHMKNNGGWVDDSTSNALNCQQMGAAGEVAGSVGPAMDLIGGSAYLNCSGAAQLDPSSITVETLFQTDTSPPTTKAFVSKGDGSTQGWDLFASTGKAAFSLDSVGASISSSSLVGSTWYYLTGAGDNSDIEIFEDGLLKSNAPGGTYSTYAGTMKIGSFSNAGPASGARGIYDEVRISDVIRSDDWIKATNETLRNSMQNYIKVEQLSENPNRYADGSDSLSIEVTVKDAYNNIRPSDSVTLTKSDGTTAIQTSSGDTYGEVASNPGTTNGSGVATFVLTTSTTAATDYVYRANAGGVSSTDTLNIDFDTPPPSYLKNVTQLALGKYHTCARLSNNTVKCWGKNDVGQLGDGTTTSSNVPVSVSGLTAVVEIQAGDYHTCARKSTGSPNVWCWGDDTYGQLGNGGGIGSYSSTPTLISGASTYKSLGAGVDSTCAQKEDTVDYLHCWGNNVSSRMGITTVSTYDTPTQDSTWSASVISHIDFGTDFGAINVGGAVLTSGDDTDGQQGTTGSTTRSDFTAAGGSLGAGVTSLRAGLKHACAIDDSLVKCWGYNLNGQLGDGGTSTQETQITVSPSITGADIGVGDTHTCAISTSDDVKCWGDNTNGKLGDGSSTQRLSPVNVSLPTISNPTEIEAGSEHTCIVVDKDGDTGTVYCWGDNTNGQLGDGSNTSSNTPVRVESQ